MADPITVAMALGTGLGAVVTHGAILLGPPLAAVVWYLHSAPTGPKREELVPEEHRQAPCGRLASKLVQYTHKCVGGVEHDLEARSRYYSRWSRYTKFSGGRITELEFALANRMMADDETDQVDIGSNEKEGGSHMGFVQVAGQNGKDPCGELASMQSDVRITHLEHALANRLAVEEGTNEVNMGADEADEDGAFRTDAIAVVDQKDVSGSTTDLRGVTYSCDVDMHRTAKSTINVAALDEANESAA